MRLGSELRAAVRGQVLVPGDADFDTGRRPWNRAVEQSVAAVVVAADAADVAALVGYAARSGRTVATQASGHGASGDTEGTILLRTGQLRELEVRPQQRLARVGAGVSWGEVLTACAPHGLVGLSGSSPVVSVVGYTTCGGLSWFGREHGIAANSVRAFDVVAADGAPARVTADSDPELFWALRGGGGDFAVVTALEFDLHPAPALYGGRMLWPAEHTGDVLAAYREVIAAAPDALSAWFELVQVPPLPEIPEQLRGMSAVLVDSALLGTKAEGEDLLRRFDQVGGRLLDTRAVLPIDQLGTIAAEPTEPGAAYSLAQPLTRLDEATATAFVDAVAGSGSVAPLVGAQLRHLGGALAGPVAGGGAVNHLPGEVLAYLVGVPFTPELTPAIGERLADVRGALAPYSTDGRKPLTQVTTGEPLAPALGADVLQRLREIKRDRDPGGVLRSNFGVLRAAAQPLAH